MASIKTDLLKTGLNPTTNAKFLHLGIPAVLIGQVIGDAPLSAGYHAVDGQWLDTSADPARWVDYCAAVDLRPGHFDMSGAERPMTGQAIHDLVSAGSLLGLCMFFRHPGFDGTPISWPVHIHLVDAEVKMKPELRGQVLDFCIGLNGLADQRMYNFFRPSRYAVGVIRAMLNNHNPQ